MLHHHTTCVYMDGNLDSFAAAWTLWNTQPNARFASHIARVLPHDIEGKDVFVMGTDIPLQDVLSMAPFANTMTVFGYEDTFLREVNHLQGQIPENVQIVADPNKSLCMLAWQFFHGSATPPMVFHHLEDRALWRFHSPDSRAINAALLSYPLDFDVWDTLLLRQPIDQLLVEGNVVLRRLSRDVEFIIRSQGRRANVGGYNVPVLNINPHMAMDAGMMVAKGEPFAACYWDTQDGRQYELISVNNGIDVGEFAHAFGGHGHRREASFTVTRGHPLAEA